MDAQSCLTLGDPVDGSPPVSSVLGISQARILERLPFPPSGDLPHPGIKPASLKSPALVIGRFFNTSVTRVHIFRVVKLILCTYN